jgi:citronellol/citronellal dehydrogenase
MSFQSVLKADLFKDQHFIVTGGGSGIGRCTAHEISSLGGSVSLIGRNLEKLQKVKSEIIEDGGQADIYTCDIRDEQRVSEVVKEILSQRQQIHGLVNNAGGQYPGPAASITQKGFEAVVKTNMMGGFLFAREVFNQGMSKTGGAIVNITADMWGGMPGMIHSGAARAGMDNITKTLAFEWAHKGVRVNSVAPGWIISSGMDTYDAAFKAVIPKLKDAVPMKRMGTESEISGMICFLLSPAAAFINGTSIKIDGGASLGNRVWPLPNATHCEPFEGFHRAETPDIFKE